MLVNLFVYGHLKFHNGKLTKQKYKNKQICSVFITFYNKKALKN